MLRKLLMTVLAAVAIGTNGAALGGDSPFGYVYTTDLHPRGSWEFEQSLTLHSGQSRGTYRAWEGRSEIEYGVSNDVQTALYANYHAVNAFRNNADGSTGGKFVPDSVQGDPADPRYGSTRFDSFSNEWIFRLLSPYKDAIGLALYVEPSYGPEMRELEGKLIVQKNFLDDQLVWAANLTTALEKQRFAGDWERESELEFATGVAYRFAPGWHAGVEYRNHREFEGFGFGSEKRLYSANFLGPSLHYASRDWWLTVSWLEQLPNAKAYMDAQRADIVGGRIYGEEHERRELRFKLGIAF